MASRSSVIKFFLTADPAGVAKGTADAEQLLSHLGDHSKKLADESQEHLKKLDEATGGVFSHLQGLFAAGATVGAIEGLKHLTDVGIEAEQVQARLEQALKNTGTASGAAQKTIEAYLDTERRRGFQDDEVKDALGRLVVATHDVTQATQLTSVASDLARARHISLADAVDKVIRVHEGNSRALKELGIDVPKVTTAQDALKASTDKYTAAQMNRAKADDQAATKQAAISALMQAVHGQADTFAGTDAGKIATFQASWQHLQETLGEQVLPVFTKVAEIVSEVMTFIGDHQAVFRDLAESVGIAVGAWAAYETVTKGAAIAQELLNLSMEENPIGLVVTALAGLVLGLREAWEHSETFRDIARGAFAVVKTIAEDLLRVVKDIGTAIDYVIQRLPFVDVGGRRAQAQANLATSSAGRVATASRQGPIHLPTAPVQGPPAPGKQSAKEYDEMGRLAPLSPDALGLSETELGRTQSLRGKQAAFRAEQAARARGETDPQKIRLAGEKAADQIDLADLKKRGELLRRALKTNAFAILQAKNALAGIRVPAATKDNAQKRQAALDARNRMRDKLRALRDERASLIAERADVSAQAAELGFDMGQIDLELRGELPTQIPPTPATDTAGTTTAPDTQASIAPFASSPAAVSPDLQAQLDQMTAAATASLGAYARSEAFTYTALGPGDIGSGGQSALGAATFNMYVSTLHPGDPQTLAAIASAAASGFSLQGYAPATSGSAGI